MKPEDPELVDHDDIIFAILAAGTCTVALTLLAVLWWAW